MQKQTQYRNVFMYFRGASVNHAQVDRQLEDNITKSLINLFEYSDKRILKDFLQSIGIVITTDNVFFDLQVANDESRTDALIRTNECDINIESKYNSPFDEEQLKKHIENTTGYILYISKEKYKEEIKLRYYGQDVIFLNWSDIADFIIKECDKNTYPKETVTSFLSRQFIDYMEELNMIPFRGWNNRDFESFLLMENENLRVAEDERKRVKEKHEQFLIELKEKISQRIDLYKVCELHMGNLDKEHVWGAIKFNEGSLINQIHISVILNAYNLSIGIQIEGHNPSQAAIKRIKNNKKKFHDILRKLIDYKYVIRKRFNIQAAIWHSVVVAEIAVGPEITSDDIEYINKKMEQYKYVELRIARIYSKHEVINGGQKFIDDCVDSIVVVNEMIQFLK